MDHSVKRWGPGPPRPWAAPQQAATSATHPLGRTAVGAACPDRKGPVGGCTAGLRLGGYRLVEPLGAGGQAVVWRAVREGSPPREVALKVLATTDTARGLRGLERLRREARRGARLAGPSILPVTDFGVAGGVGYMAMPLVEGGTLADALAQRKRGGGTSDDLWLAVVPAADFARAVAGIGVRVARALQSAHDARVIHCDVKPANILLDRHRPGRVYLADFGMGRDLEAFPAGRPWGLEGTPAYIAPERLLGRPGDGTLCDLYSLGVTLFKAATGVLPVCPHESPCRSAVLMAREAAPWLPADLVAVISVAMARDPGRRYRSAWELASDLERFLGGHHVRACRRAG